ncbi:saccharopine dehydrogenase family protein [Corallococcus sp. RDP092CA]|uniref:saccharopine dehydrogenase family protein n=1 Tax=Corallococcus sp. RDP092CA TaxID=3109369 RepID=UPI0035B495D7
MSVRIGIVGGYGRVGLEVAGYLLARTSHEVLLGGRALERATRAAAPLGERCQGREVDTGDDASLDAFCGACDVVVNCAGPATVILDRVARAALRRGIHYVDPGGYDPLYARLRERRGALERAGLRCVINAGLFPGLSGAYPLHVMKGLDAVHRLECAFIGRDAWSYGSAYDIAVSLGDFGAEHGPAYCQDGQARRVGLRSAFKRVELPAPLGAQSPMLVFTEELRLLAEAQKIPAVYGYGTNNGRWTMLAMVAVKLLRHYRTEKQRMRAARLIVSASKRDMARGAPCFAIHVEARGLRGGQEATVGGTWLCGDTYRATGVITGFAAKLATEGGLGGPGPRMLHEAVDAGALLRELRACGLPGTSALKEAA